MKPIYTLLVMCLFAGCLPGACAESIRDDFDSSEGWVGPIYAYNNRNLGNAWIKNGNLVVRRAPGGKFHMLSMKKDFVLDFQPNTWIHFRYRTREMLLGADMYATFVLDGKLIAEVGINGEQHWRMFSNCEAKEFEDEFFLSSEIIRGMDFGKRTDIRVALPDGVRGKIKYTDFHVFSVRFEELEGIGKVRFYVDGAEITYRGLDSPFPEGVFDNTIMDSWTPKPGPNTLAVSFGIFGDGDLYGDKTAGEGAGVRWLHAFADDTPAIPTTGDPADAKKKDSVMVWDWVVIASGDGAEVVEPF